MATDAAAAAPIDAAAQDRAFQLINGFRVTQMVRAAAELGLPDRLSNGPSSAEELATATGVMSDPLRRVMRALVTVGMFAEDGDGRFRGTPVSDCFLDRPGTQRAMALMLPSESYEAFAELMHTLRTGQPAFEHVFGMSRWEQLASDPEKSERFNAAMQARTEQVGAGVAAGYDFSAVRSVVDVGGGRGTLVAAILNAHPQLQGIVFDLEAGIAEAPEYLLRQGVANRCQVVKGSFFESVPAGADLYLLKNIVHDWNDARATEILARCRKAMGPGARMLLVERILPERATDTASGRDVFMLDVQMLAVLDGRERTEAEYGALLETAGLRLTLVQPPVSGLNLIEAVPSGEKEESK